MNELESYLEDGQIVDQQAVRLPDVQYEYHEEGKKMKKTLKTGSSAIMICTIKVRKIKSNVENVLQILWEREAQWDKANSQPGKRYTGERMLDELESDHEENVARQVRAPGYLAPGTGGEARRRNAAQRKDLLERAPKITRL